MATIETERLILRPHEMANLESLHRWECDSELLYFSEDDDTNLPTVEDTRALLTTMTGEPAHGQVRFAIHEKSDDAFIGYCMAACVDPNHKRCKIGITIGERDRWGRGYANEAIVALINFCFSTLQLNRIGAEIFAFNHRAIRLVERLGFRREGVVRQNVLKHGEFVDEYLYGLLREDWVGGASV